MTEIIKHECGIAMVRLLKPLSYYQKKYGSYLYGLNKLYLLMEKQHNRGQEAAAKAESPFKIGNNFFNPFVAGQSFKTVKHYDNGT